MRILVTGAAGFIGSRLSKALLDRGDLVLGFDNFDPYYDRSHKDRHLRDLLPQSNFTFLEGDLRRAAALKDIFAHFKPDAVAHLAAMAAVRYSVQHPLIYGEVNVQGTMNLLDAARQTPTYAPVACVLASTGSVYGTSTPVPFSESASADRPLAPYPASKRAMELMAHAFHNIYHIPTTIVRFFNVYGPHGRPDMMPWQWTLDILAGKPLTLYNAGHLKRDWTYIDDIVQGLTAALDYTTKTSASRAVPGPGSPTPTPATTAQTTTDAPANLLTQASRAVPGPGFPTPALAQTSAENAPPSHYEIINLGCSNPVENLSFVATLESLLNKKAIIIDTPTPPSEPMISYADVSKARKLLGYEPRTQVPAGLKNFVAWMREEGLI